MDGTIFVTKFRTAAGKRAARTLIASLRAFGGELLFNLAGVVDAAVRPVHIR